jgi:hypothetical protein
MLICKRDVPEYCLYEIQGHIAKRCVYLLSSQGILESISICSVCICMKQIMFYGYTLCVQDICNMGAAVCGVLQLMKLIVYD